MNRIFAWIVLLSLAVGSFVPGQSKKMTMPQASTPNGDTLAASPKPFVTFVELGSVNCVPCKAMQPVMKSVEAKYGAQIKVVFYDVWKKEQAHYAQQYKIRLIPTQVFLDETGTELMRHEGFFPEKEIDAFLQSKGLKPKTDGNG
jgi:thioredoxin 1